MPRGKRIHWDKDELHRLYWDEKMSMAKIARYMGVSKGAVMSKLQRLKMPMRTISQSQYRELASGWKGGRMTTTDGYILCLVEPDDFFYSMANQGGKTASYVFEHRLVIAKNLGRLLHTWEIIHHKGTKYPIGSIENKSDNRIENLQLVSGDKHRQITLLENKIKRLNEKIIKLELALKDAKRGKSRC